MDQTEQNTREKKNEKLSTRQEVREEYQGRIDRVIDHIDHHLDEPLPLEELARIAGRQGCQLNAVFSPFALPSVRALIAALANAVSCLHY